MKEERDKSFLAFLKETGRFLGSHTTDLRYFGEFGGWTILGVFIAWLVFPASFEKNPTDFRAFAIITPFMIWATLRGIYVLWRDDD